MKKQKKSERSLSWFKVQISSLKRHPFIDAEKDEIGTWLYLHAYCSEQMNGGRIENVQNSNPRFWWMIGVEPECLERPSALWRWEGQDFVIEEYDFGGEASYNDSVAAGKKGAAKRWGNNGSSSHTPEGDANGYPIGDVDNANRSPNGTPIAEEEREDQTDKTQPTSKKKDPH